jgi:ubiquinone/menaquinone biosynthesis C-methylase UbiE
MQTMEHHFTRIARKYNDIRTTDHEPIEYIRDFLSKYEHCYALDVGCGPGRYALLLLQAMPQLQLSCVDQSGGMIKETTRLLRAASVDRFKCVTADASKLPFDQNSVDVVFTFNAIHHFIMPAFLREARRVLKRESTIVIYTRLPSQFQLCRTKAVLT